MDLKDTYNKIATHWYQDHGIDDWWVSGTDSFLTLVGKGAQVLDVGCGPGIKSAYLREYGVDVVGIDFAEEMIKVAKKEVPGVHFKVCDLKDIHTLPQSFDGIFMQAVLLHIPRSEAQEIIMNMVTKLRDNGYLYIAVKGTPPSGVEEEIRKEHDYGFEYERFFSYFTIKEITQYLKYAGLNVVFEDEHVSGKTNWIQVIGQK